MKDKKEFSVQWNARLAGFCYLLTIGVGAFDHLVVGGKLISSGDAAATAQNILASERLYRLAFTLDLIPVYAVVTMIFYQLFKYVNRSLALLAALSSVIGGAVGSSAAVFQFAPVVILRGGSFLHAFEAAQIQALALTCLKLHEIGFMISLVFFGFYCFLLGWLIVASTFLPRVVGGLMALGGLAYCAFSFAYFASPALASSFGPPALILGSLGEVALTVWLLALGINVSKWRLQAGGG